jgi:hypothetical protein
MLVSATFPQSLPLRPEFKFRSVYSRPSHEQASTVSNSLPARNIHCRTLMYVNERNPTQTSLMLQCATSGCIEKIMADSYTAANHKEHRLECVAIYILMMNAEFEMRSPHWIGSNEDRGSNSTFAFNWHRRLKLNIEMSGLCVRGVCSQFVLVTAQTSDVAHRPKQFVATWIYKS